jgi:hypothetical protein
LRFQLPAEDFLAELFVEDALVEGVLVDDDHALVVLRDQIALVDLKTESRLDWRALRTGRQWNGSGRCLGSEVAGALGGEVLTFR